MSEEIEVEAAVPAAPKKRRPRKPKAVSAPVKAPKAPKTPKADKLEAQEVRHDDKTITLSGSGVKLVPMTAAQQASHGIKSIEGEVGRPCTFAVVRLTFRNTKAAETFMLYSMDAGTEEAPKDEQFILDGPKTEWHSDALDFGSM